MSSFFTLKLVFERTEKNPTANITKKGIPKFVHYLTNQETRIFSHTNDKKSLDNIGNVMCLETGFNRHVQTVSRVVSFDQNEMPNYLTGITCNGNEPSVKKCLFQQNTTIVTNIYEFEVECLCKTAIYLISLAIA
jgi:hypothetical protein